MRTHACLLLLGAAILAGACGMKPELPSQIPNTEVLGDESYEVTYRWLVEGVTDMLVHRSTSIFYVIQADESLCIYPTYRREDLVRPNHKRLFQGLTAPRLLADGSDHDFRVWVYDEADKRVKGYDGGEFLDSLAVQVSFTDAAWQEVVALAADDAGRVFVADRGPNRIYRYRVGGTPANPVVNADGQITWTSQAGGATVRDIAFAGGRLYLLDDGLGTLQVLDPASGPLDPPLFDYYDELLDDPIALAADAEHLFVINRADTTVWELSATLEAAGQLRVNTHTKEILRAPAALTVVAGRVYVADPQLGKIIDYEKRQ
jgi:hypothetical protein